MQISGSGEGKETFLPSEGWQQQGRGCWRFDREQGSAGTRGVGAALPPAQPHLPNTAPARWFHLFSQQLGHKDSRYQLLKGKAEEVLLVETRTKPLKS